jgi:ATP-binding cassette, subfamily B, bacterial
VIVCNGRDAGKALLILSRIAKQTRISLKNYMENNKKTGDANTAKPPGVASLLKPYRGLVIMLVIFALLSNGVNLYLPKMSGNAVDDYIRHTFNLNQFIVRFAGSVLFIFVFSYLQSIVQTYASEKVALDLRRRLSDKISKQSYGFVEKANPNKLLTNLTADVDSIKMFVSMVVASITSSLCIIIGVSILLLMLNWQLALCVMAIIPIISGIFFYVIKKVRVLFKESRAVIDWLNKVINESILGAALIRVINSQQLEYSKFLEANTKAKDYGFRILNLFAGLIPIITFTANMAVLSILLLGGHFTIAGKMTLGNFIQFNAYLSMLIFPILVIGFMSNIIAQASASYQRIYSVLDSPELPAGGDIKDPLNGDVELKDVSVSYGQKPALKNVSFSVNAGSKIAVIGPTAAGKTQLLYLLTGLIKPNSGEIKFDARDIDAYNSESFHSQVGFVFQDSIIFNMSIRENIAFSDTVTDELLEKAINTAELRDFINSLPDKLNTVVSERGSSLSGGQKQRIMLARALAINPKVLLLDDFTARVDNKTEKKILGNLQKNYPGLTLISVTQKISAIEHYDKIIVLTQGEVVAEGKHDDLMHNSPEYVQIFNSQQSTNNYETITR